MLMLTHHSSIYTKYLYSFLYHVFFNRWRQKIIPDPSPALATDLAKKGKSFYYTESSKRGYLFVFVDKNRRKKAIFQTTFSVTHSKTLRIPEPFRFRTTKLLVKADFVDKTCRTKIFLYGRNSVILIPIQTIFP